MSILVKVKNFQSIDETELLIDGLTVVTGPNNSGKTALMRAVRGVFTNPAAGPLVRHGCAYLSVSLQFEDGTNICWEKGWEKPEQKGKSINRYVINGVTIQGVGRGVPPEVAALGVRDIPAASERVWPQIAEQFDGTLFLLNRPGSAIAEALSDVEKVGRLTDALKLCERDVKAAEGELKIRRLDLEGVKLELSSFDGLDRFTAIVSELRTRTAALRVLEQTLLNLRSLNTRLMDCRTTASAYRNFNVLVPPEGRAAKVGTALLTLRSYASRLEAARFESLRYLRFGVTAPDTAKASRLKDELAWLSTRLNRLRAARGGVQALASLKLESVQVDFSKAQRIQSTLATLTSLRSRRREARASVQELHTSLSDATTAMNEAVAEVRKYLGDQGACPVCGSLCRHESTHTQSPEIT